MSSESPAPRPQTIEAFLAAESMMVIAHRGFSGQAPENTLEAIRQAIELGADMVEIDVTLTSDGEIVVIHDETLERTTDGEGPVLEATLEEIRRLDAGSWFDARYTGEKVPTLDEVLELIAGRILLNIEIKHEAVQGNAAGGIAEKIDEAVRRRALTEQVIVSSFDPRALAHLRALGSELVTASLYAHRLHRDLLPSQVTAQVGARAFNIGGRHLDKAKLEDCRTHDIPLSVYTVNEPADMKRLLAAGVDAIFTDYPNRLLTLLNK